MYINCFAYNAEKCCQILKTESGCGYSCPFYKNREELEAGRIKSNKRLASLPDERQRYIAETYHGGKRTWLETAQKAVSI